MTGDRWAGEVDRFIRQFAERAAENWDNERGDLEEVDPGFWFDRDHPNILLDIAYQRGIVPPGERSSGPAPLDGPVTRLDLWRPRDTSLDGVARLRRQLWQAGYRPVPVYTSDKRPRGNDWVNLARRDPPAAIVEPTEAEALNTGILCDGLRAIDVDIDVPEIAAEVRTVAERMLGRTVARSRSNAPRFLLIYRADAGEPPKRQIVGEHGKIEALGRGQQFVAFGLHPSGAPLQWSPTAPGPLCRRDVLPRIHEDQVTAFFAAVAPTIAALVEPPVPKRSPSDPPPDIGHASLTGVLRKVTQTREGNRNSALYWGARRFAEAIEKGLLGETDARALLLHAADLVGLDERQATDTITSAFRGAA